MNLAEEIRGTQVPPDHLGICWLGQAGFLLKAPDGTSMVLDPYLTECGERIRGFKRLSPMLIAPEELAVDYYVTSHLHFDHFDYDAIPIVAQCTKRTLFFGPASKMYEHKDSYVIEYFNIIKKIFVKTYYSLTKDDNIINRIKENKLYGINKTSTKYFDDILSSPRRRIK